MRPMRKTVTTMESSVENDTLIIEEQEYSQDFVNFTKNGMYSEMFSKMAGELKDAECYMQLYEDAGVAGCECLEKIFSEIARDEIEHYEMIHDYIVNTYGNLKENILYPLLKNLEDWKENLKDELEEMK